MSLSWNRRIHISVLATGATFHWEQAWPRRLLACHEVQMRPGDLHAAMGAAAATLESLGWSGKIFLTLGSQWLRFAALPWVLQSGNDVQDASVAAHWLTQSLSPTSITPDLPTTAPTVPWQITLDQAHFGQDRLFMAVPTDQAPAIGLLHSKRCPLQAWQPWIMSAWNACRRELPASAGTLYLAEPGVVTVVNYEKGRVAALQQRRFPADHQEGLLSLMRLEQLRAPQPLNIYAPDLPPVWQAALGSMGRLLQIPPSTNAPSSSLSAEGVAP